MAKKVHSVYDIPPPAVKPKLAADLCLPPLFVTIASGLTEFLARAEQKRSICTAHRQCNKPHQNSIACGLPTIPRKIITYSLTIP